LLFVANVFERPAGMETQGHGATEAEVASSSFWSIPVEISQGRVPAISVQHAVKFQFRCEEAQFGDRLLVMGGWLDWQEHDAIELKCTHFPEWVAEAAVPPGVHEFKLLLIKADSERKWEPIDHNRNVEVAHSCTVGGTFGTVIHNSGKGETADQKSCERCGIVASSHSNCPKCWGPVADEAASMHSMD
jgi:hypothetical protein